MLPQVRLAWFDHVKYGGWTFPRLGSNKKNMNLMGPSWEQLVPGHPDSCNERLYGFFDIHHAVKLSEMDLDMRISKHACVF